LTLDKKKKHFQRIKSSIKYLTKLVEDMLIVNQAETGNLEFSPTVLNVEQIAREIIDECQVNPANPHRILFDCHGSCTNVFLDEKLLQLILRNLLSNAIKFSPDHNPIRLELSCEPSQVVLRLSDQGIGILPTEKPWLFNPFFRGSNIGVTPGVGLGLVIVKECVDLHGGEILVESEVGQGTTFTVTLPIGQPSQE
jgi:signal transduction histidine kinase